MDIQEVKTCLRALLSSTAFEYNLNNLLNDFKNMTGKDMPLFGYLHPVEFLRTLDDTIQLIGNPFDPQIALIESKKSAHITSLVDRQRTDAIKKKYPHFMIKQKRLVLPGQYQQTGCLTSTKSQSNSKPQLFLQSEFTFSKPKETKTELVFSNPPSLPEKDKTVLKKECPSHVDESQEVEKADSSYFEDVSDNESSLSNERSRSSSGNPVSSTFSSVNDGIKNKLKQLIKLYPEGLWCCELPELFLEEFHFVLDYREFGYMSLIQMLSELPEVFRCIRPGNEDWILFDASVPPSREEKKMMLLQSTGDSNREVRANLKKLLLNHLSDTSDSGIELTKIPDLYKKTYGCCLDVESLGFKDVKSLLESWEGSSLHMLKINGSVFVVPALKMQNLPPAHLGEAVPPVTAENDLFVEIFPKDVVGPDENLIELDLYRHVAVGHVVEVCVAEVWSPTKFYLQLNKFKNRLNRFMDDLQRFYEVHLNKYKMPNSTLRPNQICVGLYSSEPEFPDEWHRAKIVKVINEKTVLINFVDFGTVARVKKTQLRFLHRSFQYLPVQAFLAELSGVAPPNDQGIWPMSTNKKFLEYLRLPYFKAEIVEVDFKKPSVSVILFDSFQKPMGDINRKLIQEKLAWEKEPVNDDPFLLPEPEIEKLKNSKPIEEKKKPSEKSSTSSKNLANEFSDFTDLDESTLFYFQMKSLKLETSSSSQEKDLKTNENEKVTFEFEDVPDLDKNNEKEVPEVKENTQNDVLETKKPYSKFIPASLSKNITLPKPVNSEPPPLITSFPSSKLKSHPPGLEQVSIFPPFSQTLFLMNPENTKKRINILAMELLSKNPSIQQVGMNDPVLALKIATEMAEAYISSELNSTIPQGFNPLLSPPPLLVPPTLTTANAQSIGFTAATQTDLPDIMEIQAKPKTPPAKSNPEINVDKININGKNIHVVELGNELYFCADEIVRTFTLISSREIADRVFVIKRINIEYRILTKKSDEHALKVIKSCDIPVIKNKSKKLKIYLLPVDMVVPFLKGLGCQTQPFEKEFFALEKTKKEDSTDPK